ncbi:uncharacterized protein [Triticum aestivum]|uniref:uncharacterized protein n=1 Tax=Triticum aestivum TaxID=4565 RepID=UPI001D00C235|nr:uncharacterized protein LOC123075981 [Triticum aestivum]
MAKKKKGKSRRAAQGAPSDGETAIGRNKMQTGTDPPCAIIKHRIPEHYVRFILDQTSESPMEEEEISYLRRNPSLLPGCSVDEVAARHKRIDDGFERFKTQVRDQWFANGYVEVDYDYVGHITAAEEEDRALWQELRRKRGMTNLKYADPNDPVYADFYDA